MTKSVRAHRMADLIQASVASIVHMQVSDPRLNGITITAVDVSPDGKKAIIFYSLFDNEHEKINDSLKAFRKAKGFIRSVLSQQVVLRYTPDLDFKYDVTGQQAQHISDLLKDVLQ